MRPSASPSAKDHFYARLESLRGLAALTVVAFHASLTSWAPNKTLAADTFQDEQAWRGARLILIALFNGAGAVNLFFVLSGFVLASSLARGPVDSWLATREFTIGRVFRIYPAVWASVLVYALIFGVLVPASTLHPGPVEFSDVILNMLLLKVDLNGVMWSLQVELVAIPLILLLGLLDRRIGPAPIAAASIALLALSFIGFWTVGFSGLSLNPLAAFTFGMLIRHAKGSVGTLRRYQVSLLLIAASVLFFAARPLLGNSTGAFRWITILESISSAILVALIAFRSELAIGRFLDRPLWRFYGRISYSLYLLHALALLVVWSQPERVRAWLEWGVPNAVMIILMAALVIIMATPIAWLSWRYIELPGIAIGRGIARRATGPQPANR